MSIHSANRRFEEMFPGIFKRPGDPGYRAPLAVEYDPADCKVIATVITNIETGEIRIERPNDKRTLPVPYPTGL
jgi:hypothetical protein